MYAERSKMRLEKGQAVWVRAYYLSSDDDGHDVNIACDEDYLQYCWVSKSEKLLTADMIDWKAVLKEKRDERECE
jgi:hypothetical protein